MSSWCMMALQKLFCLSHGKRCVPPMTAFAPTRRCQGFLLQFCFGTAFFCGKPREHSNSASHAHATPFLPLAMHFAHDQKHAILRICYALRSKRSNINRLRHFQTTYNKHYVNKTPNLGKIERKNPPRPRPLVGVSVCNPTHILHLFLPPLPRSYNLTITRRKNHAWET